MSSSLDRMMSWELRDLVRAKEARIRELEQEIARLIEEKRGTPFYCEPEDSTCENKVPLCYEHEMKDCDRVSCPSCKRVYVITDHGCDGFALDEIEA